MTQPISQRPTVRQMAEAGVVSLDALASVSAHVVKRELEAARLRLRCRATEPPTYQERLHREHEESMRELANLVEGNRVEIECANGNAGLVARDWSGRIVLVKLSAPALQQLIRDAQDALHQLTETSAPETLRGTDDVLRGES